MWVPKMSSDLLARDDAYRVCRFPAPYDRCSSGTTKSGIVRLRRWDVPAHHQDCVDTPHFFNPFIPFTGPDEVFGTHRTNDQH